MDNSVFFDATSDLTTSAVLTIDNEILVGYFDILDADFFVDDAEAGVDAQFLCEDWAGRPQVVGKSLEVSGTAYRINKATPDGTGLVTLKLMKEG